MSSSENHIDCPGLDYGAHSVKAHFSLINDHFIYYQLAPLND